jgi:hypothetical protein
MSGFRNPTEMKIRKFYELLVAINVTPNGTDKFLVKHYQLTQKNLENPTSNKEMKLSLKIISISPKGEFTSKF